LVSVLRQPVARRLVAPNARARWAGAAEPAGGEPRTLKPVPARCRDAGGAGPL